MMVFVKAAVATIFAFLLVALNLAAIYMVKIVADSTGFGESIIDLLVIAMLAIEILGFIAAVHPD